jgi:hypothetical protein
MSEAPAANLDSCPEGNGLICVPIDLNVPQDTARQRLIASGIDSYRTLRDGFRYLRVSQAFHAGSPSQTTAHPKRWVGKTNRYDRDVGLAESGYYHLVPPGHMPS